MKKISKIFLVLFAVLFFALPLAIPSHNASAVLSTPTCAPGDGCLAYPSCGGAAPYGADIDCNPATCSISGTGGLIPCGKNCDDPDTGDWVETDDCDLCDMVLMGQLIIEFLLKISAVAALLAIAFGGILYIFAAGSPGTIDKAKTIIKYTLIGFLIVFISWAIIDTILVMFGYIDPIGGDWYSINCS